MVWIFLNMLVCEAIDFAKTLRNPKVGTKPKYQLNVEKNGDAMLESGSVIAVTAADDKVHRVIVGATQKVGGVVGVRGFSWSDSVV